MRFSIIFAVAAAHSSVVLAAPVRRLTTVNTAQLKADLLRTDILATTLGPFLSEDAKRDLKKSKDDVEDQLTKVTGLEGSIYQIVVTSGPGLISGKLDNPQLELEHLQETTTAYTKEMEKEAELAKVDIKALTALMEMNPTNFRKALSEITALLKSSKISNEEKTMIRDRLIEILKVFPPYSHYDDKTTLEDVMRDLNKSLDTYEAAPQIIKDAAYKEMKEALEGARAAKAN